MMAHHYTHHTPRDNYGENGRHGTTNNNKGTNDVNMNDKE